MFDFNLLSLNPFSYIFLVSILTTINLIILLVMRRVHSPALVYFLLLLFVSSVMSVAHFFIINTSSSEVFEFWYHWDHLALTLIPPLELAFAIAYVGKEGMLIKHWFVLLNYTPLFFILYLLWNTSLIQINDINEATLTSWGYAIKPGPYLNLFTLYHLVYYIPAYILMIRFYFKEADRLLKKQALLIIIALLIPTAGGVFFQGIMPGFFNISAFPASGPLVTITNLIITFALIRYGVSIFTPITLTSTVLKTITEAIVAFDNSYRIKYLNPAAEGLLNYSQKQLLGLPLRTIFSSDKEYFNLVQKISSAFTISYPEIHESQIVNSNQQLIPVSWSISPIIEEGKSIGHILVMTDITKIKNYIFRLENMGVTLEKMVKDRTHWLLAERDKLAMVLSGIHDAIIAVDLNRYIVIFNNAAETLTGFSRREVLGKPIDLIIKFYDHEQNIHPLNYCPIITDASNSINFSKKDIKLIGKKKEVYVDLVSGQIEEGPNANIGCIITLHDVSKEKELEKMKLDFVAMAAHQLRTPIASIRGYLYLLKKNLTKGGNYQQFLDRVTVSAKQLADYVDNLLSVSRIERGISNSSIHPLDWVEFIKKSLSDLEIKARSKNVQLQFIIPHNRIPLVLADKTKIDGVINNLLTNAIDFNKEEGKVMVWLETDGSYVTTHIKDTGEGIPEDALPHLFNKFFRASGPLISGSKGTGLGLYIAKSIVEQHRGRIRVSSKVGEGSTFSFSLPAYKAKI